MGQVYLLPTPSWRQVSAAEGGGRVAGIGLIMNALMDRASILALLRQHHGVLSTRFGAKHLALFGSAARDEMRTNSDIDVLVGFGGPATFDGYFNLKDYIEALLYRPVDLVTSRGVKPRGTATCLAGSGQCLVVGCSSRL